MGLCERCGEGVMALGQYLQTDEEIAAVEQGLVDLVCTTLPEENIDGYCTKRIPYGQQDVTCAECETFLGKIATLLETPDFAAIVAADLEGKVFCENPEYIEAANVDACKEFMALVDKQAVAALGPLLRVSASRICTDNGCTY